MNFRTILFFTSFLTLGTLFAQRSFQSGENVAVAATPSGKIRGVVINDIFTYKGIPYATAERFEAPQPIAPWEGVKSHTTWGPVAPLLNPTTQVRDESETVFNHDWGYTSEDCLRINVWTPGINDNKKRPVMFWIHGGGYTAGSSQELPSYHGERLSKKGDVVVVSINHRLNVLGFLDLSDFGTEFEDSANLSMLDLVAALKWVNENIESFGGDPNNVTIFGQSGGGAKVNTLMAMPAAQGLFHKAINQSGAVRASMPTAAISKRVGKAVVENLGLNQSSIQSIKDIPYAQLSAAGAQALKKVADELKEEGTPVSGWGLNWGPSQDGKNLPYQFYSDEARALYKDIPLMIGTVKNEFMASLGTGLSFASEASVMEYINKQYGTKAAAYLNAVKKAYPNDKNPSDWIDVDTRFRPGSVLQANNKSSIVGGAPVYMYLFTWQSPVFDGKYKAMHCFELPFVFDNIERCAEMTGGTPEAYVLASKMSAAWIQFARQGNPNHQGLPNWPAYNSKNTATMHFDNECQVLPQRDKELFALLEE